VLFVGPRDLSPDLGVPGDFTAPAFIVAIGSDTILLATAVSAEFGRARTSSKPQ
jgi:hypothetical protein